MPGLDKPTGSVLSAVRGAALGRAGRPWGRRLRPCPPTDPVLAAAPVAAGRDHRPRPAGITARPPRTPVTRTSSLIASAATTQSGGCAHAASVRLEPHEGSAVKSTVRAARSGHERRRRPLVGLVLGLAAVVTVSGCAAGQVSQTASQVAAIDGAN